MSGKNKNNKLFTIIVSSITLVIVGGFWFLMPKKAPPVTEKTAVVTQGNVSVALNTDGKIVLDRRELSFEINGLIRKVNFKEGDQIGAGQTIATIDAQEAQKNLQNELRDYSIQRNDFEEMKQVTFPEGALTDTIKRILEKNQWNLEKSVLDVELKDLAIRKSALKSPIAGIITDLKVKVGEVSNTNKIAAIVIDPSSILFEGWLEDLEAVKVKPGMKVRFSFDALPNEEVTGEVKFVSPMAVIDENDLSTYKVIITVNNPPELLLDGMSGEVEIISKEANNVLKLPNSAIKREGGEAIVMRQNDLGELEKVPVVLGFTNGKEVEIKSGLASGQKVIDFK